MTVEEFISAVPGFADLPHGEKIKLLIWWLHIHAHKEQVRTADISALYARLHLAASNTSQELTRLADRREVLQSRGTFRLERTVLDALNDKHGRRPATIHVDQLLASLPGRLSAQTEANYLEETLICYRNKAFRAAVVMAWNLAYDHLCQWILKDPGRLARFNAQTPMTFARRGLPVVITREDFLEFKESEVLQIAKSAPQIINANQHKILKEKLDRRNIAAHPSGIQILPQTAEEYIRELIEVIVLQLN